MFLKTLGGKKKILVTSIFSSSPHDFRAFRINAVEVEEVYNITEWYAANVSSVMSQFFFFCERWKIDFNTLKPLLVLSPCRQQTDDVR